MWLCRAEKLPESIDSEIRRRIYSLIPQLEKRTPYVALLARRRQDIEIAMGVPTARPEVPKASERSAEEAEQARRLQEDRLRAEAASREAARTAFVNENIHFAFDSSVLSGQARQILEDKAKYLRTDAV
jgi:outer membrane protein OmpA-like peptidoglycan-associated protein